MGIEKTIGSCRSAAKVKLRSLFEKSSAKTLDVAQTACEEFGVPCPLALAVMEQESSFQVDAVSSAGCYGLMQLNPEYFPADLTPAENIRAGVQFLGELLAKYDDTAAALTAYNAGHDTGRRVYADAVLARVDRWTQVATDDTTIKQRG